MWFLRTWPLPKKDGSVYPKDSGTNGVTYDWSSYGDSGDLIKPPRDDPEPGTSEGLTPVRNQSLLRIGRDSSVVWLRWDEEPVSSTSSVIPLPSQNDDDNSSREFYPI